MRKYLPKFFFFTKCAESVKAPKGRKLLNASVTSWSIPAVAFGDMSMVNSGYVITYLVIGVILLFILLMMQNTTKKRTALTDAYSIQENNPDSHKDNLIAKIYTQIELNKLQTKKEDIYSPVWVAHGVHLTPRDKFRLLRAGLNAHAQSRWGDYPYRISPTTCKLVTQDRNNAPIKASLYTVHLVENYS